MYVYINAYKLFSILFIHSPLFSIEIRHKYLLKLPVRFYCLNVSVLDRNSVYSKQNFYCPKAEYYFYPSLNHRLLKN